jgi:hypothetical protein
VDQHTLRDLPQHELASLIPDGVAVRRDALLERSLLEQGEHDRHVEHPRRLPCGSSTQGSSSAAPQRGAARSLQPHGSRYPDASNHLRARQLGPRLAPRQRRTPGPAAAMDELRVRHLGVPPKPHDGPGPLERLKAIYVAAAGQEHVD